MIVFDLSTNREENCYQVKKLLWEYAEEEVFVFDLVNYAKSINGGKNIDEDDIDEWFNCGINYQGFENLTD